MKLVSFEEFNKMPAGTVFARYEPNIFKECLSIKTDTGEPAPMYCHFTHIFNGVMPLEPWIDPDDQFYKVGDELPASFEIYDGSTADYMNDDMFLVFDSSDIDRMINALVWAKNDCVGECDCSVDTED